MRSITLTLLLGSALAAASSFGSVAASDPAGFTRQTIHPGRQTVGITLNHPTVAAAGIVGSDARSARLDTAPGHLAQALESNAAYYAEIAGATSEAFSGDRFDIDVAATKAADGSVLFFKDAPHNSTSVALPSDALAGHRVIIRRHLTIGDVFGTGGQALLNAGFRYEEADHLLFFDRIAGGYFTYYLCQDATSEAREWRKLGSIGDEAATIIPPGTGLFVVRNSAAPADLVLMGAVRTNDFVMPLAAGYNFVASPYPGASTPGELQMNSANGFVAASGSTPADEIIAFNGEESECYRLHRTIDGSTEQWRRDGDSETISTAELLTHRSSVFLKKVAADPDFVTRRSFPL